jgi:hypothetical protein
MDLIDQLCGQPMRLQTAIGLFDDVGHARRVLTHYIDGRAIAFLREGRQLTQWEAMNLLRTTIDQPEIVDVEVAITKDAGAAFDRGTWMSFF